MANLDLGVMAVQKYRPASEPGRNSTKNPAEHPTTFEKLTKLMYQSKYNVEDLRGGRKILFT